MKNKASKKLKLDKINISKLNRSNMILVKGGSVLDECEGKTDDNNDPECKGSEFC